MASAHKTKHIHEAFDKPTAVGLGMSFFLMVATPTVAGAAGLGAVPSHAYLSESRFVARSSGQTDAPRLGGPLKGIAPLAGTENAMVVRSFLLARESMSAFERTLGLRKHHGNQRKGDL